MVDWLLNCEPRAAQLEALRRSWYGEATQDTLDGPTFSRKLAHFGQPARGWGHFLEQRVGKTPTWLNEFMLARQQLGFKWGIMLAPNSFKEDWPLEAAKFGLDCDAFAFESTRRKDAQKFVDQCGANGGLIAVNYEALKSPETMAFLGGITGGTTMVGADESVSIKTHNSKATLEAIMLARECGLIRCMSGKPMTQGPHDFWSQLRFMREINGWNYVAWKNEFCETGGFMGKAIKGAKNVEKLQEILGRCSWTARKVDWLKTPGSDYAFRPQQVMLPEQARLYQQMDEDFILEVAEGKLVVADQIVTKLIKLQQISSGFVIDEEGQAHDIVDPKKNPRILDLKRLLSEEINTKVIVVCHYQHTMDTLERELAEFGPCVIRGDVWHQKNGRDRITEKSKFNGSREHRVMIGQEQALRYGHTLMGTHDDPCTTVYFFENDYSLNNRSQCEERPQGVGQLAPITIWDCPVSKRDRDTIGALQRKEDVVAIVMAYARSTGVLPR